MLADKNQQEKLAQWNWNRKSFDNFFMAANKASNHKTMNDSANRHVKLMQS